MNIVKPYKLFLKTVSILFLFLLDRTYAQDTDTSFWVGDIFTGVNRVKSISQSFGDTIKQTSYWKGKVLRIEYRTILNGCIVPILTDTIYSESDSSYFSTVQHHIIHLSGSMKCDSILRISTVHSFQNGVIQRKAKFKTLGSFAKCPCGRWEFYNRGELVFDTLLIPCENTVLNNIELNTLSWRPDSTYYVEVYKEENLYALPGHGGDHSATIVLKKHSGESVKVVSSVSAESVMLRSVNIAWSSDKNMLSYSKARTIEWVDEDKVDIERISRKINTFLKTDNWTFFKTPEIFGDKYYAIGEFYGEPEYDRTLDFAVLIKDSTSMVKLLLIDNYNYDGQEKFDFVDEAFDYEEIGRFRAVRVGTPLWSNYIDSKGDSGVRTFEEVPEKERIYLTYDAFYVHAGESCGGGFIFWKDNKWNWLQQE
jgi:hypothetical protein